MTNDAPNSAVDKPRRDFRQDLTDQIVQLVEQGVAPWQKPWNANAASLALEMPRNATTGRAYRGGNAVWLMLKAQGMGSADPRWCTFKQAQDAGWKIRKGAKGTSVEYWQFDREETRQNPTTGKTEKIRVKLENPRVFYATVFHASQIDGIPEHAPRERADGWDPVTEAERILAGSGARFYHDQQDRAYYAVGADEIHLPPREAFPRPLDYYEVALHELGHWTGHLSRMNRDLSGAFGSEPYAREELRAQMASLFLAAELGVPFNPERHAAYQASWVKSLRSDKHEIFRAARDAEQMAGYVMGLSVDRRLEADPEPLSMAVELPAFQQREPQQDPLAPLSVPQATGHMAVGLHEQTSSQKVFPRPEQQFRLSDDVPSTDQELSMTDKNVSTGDDSPAGPSNAGAAHAGAGATAAAGDEAKLAEIRARRSGGGQELVDGLRASAAARGADGAYAAWVGMDVSDLTALANREMRAQAIEEMARTAARDIDYRLALTNWPDIARDIRLAMRQLPPETPESEVSPMVDPAALQDKGPSPVTPGAPSEAEQGFAFDAGGSDVPLAQALPPEFPAIEPDNGDPGYDPSFGGFDNGLDHERVDPVPHVEGASTQPPVQAGKQASEPDPTSPPTVPSADDEPILAAESSAPAELGSPQQSDGLTQAPAASQIDGRYLSAESANHDPAANNPDNAQRGRPVPRHPLRKVTEIEGGGSERLQKSRQADVTAAQAVLDGSKALQQQADELAAERRQAETAPQAASGQPAAQSGPSEENELVGNASPEIDTSAESVSPVKPVFDRTGYVIPAAIGARYVVRDGSFWDAKAQLTAKPVNGNGKPQPVATPKPIFVDHGPRLSTHKDDRTTVADMVSIAQAKGWTSFTVRGSETYRRNAWIEGSLAGLEVQGFRPAEHDQVALEAARREREALRITPGHTPQPSLAKTDAPRAAPSSAEPAPAAASAPAGPRLQAVPDQTVSVSAMRRTFQASIAGQPENIRREATMRFDARVKAIVEVQAMGLAPAAQKVELEKRFGELEAAWNRPAEERAPTTKPTPERERTASMRM